MIVAGTLSAEENVPAQEQWPSWRGPVGTGEAPSADPPVEWSMSDFGSGFRVEVEGSGHGSPLIWGDRILLTAARTVGEEVGRPAEREGAHDNLLELRRQRFVALAFSRQDGSLLWERALGESMPRNGHHRSASYASASPSTDGRVFLAPFGSEGLWALDLQGELLWTRRLGPLDVKHGHGEGASPLLVDGRVVLVRDHEGRSELVALDATDGRTLWTVPRNGPTGWSSPVAAEVAGRIQVVVAGTPRLRGYDLESGKLLWECDGLSGNVVATPVVGEGLVFAGSSYEKRSLLAVRLQEAEGDVTGTSAVVWTRQRGTPYVPSPLLVDGGLYFLRHYQPILTRVEAATGEDRPGPVRLTGLRDVYASPVAAAGRVYVTDRLGTTIVLSAGPEPRVLALNRLGEEISASAAMAGPDLVLRGRDSLILLRNGAVSSRAIPAGGTPEAAQVSSWRHDGRTTDRRAGSRAARSRSRRFPFSPSRTWFRSRSRSRTVRTRSRGRRLRDGSRSCRGPSRRQRGRRSPRPDPSGRSGKPNRPPR